MKCARCKRPIFTVPAATIRSKDGINAYGPKCARIAGLTEGAVRRRAPVVPVTRAKHPDPDQLTLELDQ